LVDSRLTSVTNNVTALSSPLAISAVGGQSWVIRNSIPQRPIDVRGTPHGKSAQAGAEAQTGLGHRREEFGTHSLRRTKASIIYKDTGNLRAVQILLGHTKIENTVRYLGVDVEDALMLAEGTEI
jgi:integrase